MVMTSALNVIILIAYLINEGHSYSAQRSSMIGQLQPWSRSAASSSIRYLSATAQIDKPYNSLVEKPVEKPAVFDWFKAWYPLVPVEILDREKPHKFHLLGQDVVVWYDGPVEGGGHWGAKTKRPKGAKRSEQGTWRAFVDECPHRKVPLSEGRVEDDGTLLCSYHAWKFDGTGKCVSVPQVESIDELTRIKNNPKTNCNAFPTKVINGLLFVWPSADENATLESELTPVVHRAAETNKERMFEGPWNFRELPYGADYFIENVVDPGRIDVTEERCSKSFIVVFTFFYFFLLLNHHSTCASFPPQCRWKSIQ